VDQIDGLPDQPGGGGQSQGGLRTSAAEDQLQVTYEAEGESRRGGGKNLVRAV